MKKAILLFSVLCFAIGASYAQSNEGRVQAGGSISFSHLKEDNISPNPNYTNTNLIVTPSVGRFYNTNRLAGLFLNFSYFDGEDVNGKTINRSYGGGLYFRQYQPVLNKLYIFLEENGGYNYTSITNGNTKSHYYTIEASLEMGMAYDITKKMQLEISLNNLANAYYRKGDYIKGYGISTSLEKNTFSNIGFGFRYYLK